MELIVGIDIGGTKVAVGVGNEIGQIFSRSRRSTAECGDGDALLEAVCRMVDECLEESGSATPLTRIGLGLPYSSFSCWAKSKAKQAVNFVADFEKELVGEARRVGVDGVVCGHIHKARILDLPDVRYINTGDWVESCTAVAENHDGTIEMICWPLVRAAPAPADMGEVAEDWVAQPAE